MRVITFLSCFDKQISDKIEEEFERWTKVHVDKLCGKSKRKLTSKSGEIQIKSQKNNTNLQVAANEC